MLVSDQPTELVSALLKLRELARSSDKFPPMRMGVAHGDVAARAGDVYGRAVNLASRLADLAEPGQLLAAAELEDFLPADFEHRQQPTREIKGIGPYRPLEILPRSAVRSARRSPQ